MCFMIIFNEYISKKKIIKNVIYVDIPLIINTFCVSLSQLNIESTILTYL